MTKPNTTANKSQWVDHKRVAGSPNSQAAGPVISMLAQVL